MAVETIQNLCARVREQVARVVVGQDAVLDALLVALLSKGHVLLEGPPGTAKTLLARVFSKCLNLQFSRVQFTPDLLPADILGTSLFNFQTNQFQLVKGPVFTDVLLADEINRTPPKTQSALLQAMQERVVTLDGAQHRLSQDFLVIATQNPIEHEGTYPVPEAQLDRFLLKIQVPYPSRGEELEIVRTHGSTSGAANLDAFDLSGRIEQQELAEAHAFVQGLRLAESLVEYVVDLGRATREHSALAHGPSPRALAMLSIASRSLAAIRGRTYVIPDDIKELFAPVLQHRIVLSPGAEIEGLSESQVLRQVLEQVPAPR